MKIKKKKNFNCNNVSLLLLIFALGNIQTICKKSGICKVSNKRGEIMLICWKLLEKRLSNNTNEKFMLFDSRLKTAGLKSIRRVTNCL